MFQLLIFSFPFSPLDIQKSIQVKRKYCNNDRQRTILKLKQQIIFHFEILILEIDKAPQYTRHNYVYFYFMGLKFE